MNENDYSFREILVLAYYDVNYEGSSLTELAELLGLTFKRAESVLSKCMEEGLLAYDESNLLRVSCLGKDLLSRNNMNGFFDENITSNLFDRDPLALDEIYIPKNFSKKT